MRGVPTTARDRGREFAVRTLWILADALCWVVAVVGTMFTRLELRPTVLTEPGVWVLAGSASVVHIVVGLSFGPYMVRHVRGSFEEVTSVTRTAAITGLALTAVAFFVEQVFLPRSVPFIGTALAIVLMLATRFIVRSFRYHRAGANAKRERVILFGAGLAGRRLAYNMLHDDRSELRPVAFIDDDRRKRKLRVEGVPVLGTRADLAKVASRTGASHLVVAMPHADAELLREVSRLAEDADLHVKVLPRLNDWVRHTDPRGADLRDLDLEDLLGRRAVQLDQVAISEHLTGKVVLVTGAGGSIGSELCRQIARYGPTKLLLLDRDESALQSTELSLTGRGLQDSDDLLLVDIVDPDAVRRAFAQHRPDVVFHAAALKHLPLLERFPHAAWKTNVQGTLNVLMAAAESGVGSFVNISTDKAANPMSVLGYTKRITERLTASFAYSQPGIYVSVRFGNVLGSRGSVIPLFAEQIRNGGPVTVTDPKVERFFMLIPEACQLVMQAAAMGSDGDVMVLDMGAPVRIDEVARTLISMSGRDDVQIVYTGLRPGEKISEEVFGFDRPRPTDHDLLTAVRVPPLHPAAVEGASFERHGQLVRWLRDQATPWTGDVRSS